MIGLVTFDLDDTLYPEEEFVFSGFKVISEYIKSNYTYKFDFYRLFVSLYEDGVRGDIFNRALSMAGIEYEDELIGELVRLYRDHQPDIRLYNDAEEILRELSGRFILGLITDGYLSSQRSKVERLGIADYFDKIIFTDEFGPEAWKPSEFAFENMMRHFHFHGKQCVYVADNPHKDFLAPRKLGWLTVRVIRENGQYKGAKVAPEWEAHQTVFSLRELRSVLHIRE